MMLILAELRSRWAGFLAAFLAVLVGTGLITAALTVRNSAAPAVQSRLAGAAAVVVPPRAVDPDGSPADRVPWSEEETAGLLAALRDEPGIAGAVVDRAFYAQAFRDGRPVPDQGAAEAGHGWSASALAPYRLVDGRAPAASDEVVIAAALGVPTGSRLAVNLTAGRAEFTVTGTLDGPGYWFEDRIAAARAPGVRAIALLAAPAPGPPGRPPPRAPSPAVAPRCSPVPPGPRSSPGTWSTSASSPTNCSPPSPRWRCSPPPSWWPPRSPCTPGCAAATWDCCG
ncbi:hypothetical protein [Kitasatospora cheerisanensis]|uniref:hypothetical protein n=1 Tax=Kitasatospora cheerisanensis TaxID=81942 RepID=UPI000A71BAE6|nr:hypothetical protein [Kitasatospora cheerisanensis]